MSWFEEQIKLRKKHDEMDLADAIEDISASILHRRNASFDNDRKNIKYINNIKKNIDFQAKIV